MNTSLAIEIAMEELIPSQAQQAELSLSIEKLEKAQHEVPSFDSLKDQMDQAAQIFAITKEMRATLEKAYQEILKMA